MFEALGRMCSGEFSRLLEIHKGFKDLLALGPEGPRTLERTRMPAHFTVSLRISNGSGLVVLMEHPRLGIQTYPGGHVDQGESPLEACLREAQEEIGVPPTWLHMVSEEPIAIGLHQIPGGTREPAHYHADLLFGAQLMSENVPISQEGIIWEWKSDIALLEKYYRFK